MPCFCTYLLTIRRVRFDATEAEDFRKYFELLAASGCEVLVVNGSPPDVFDEHGDGETAKFLSTASDLGAHRSRADAD